MTIRRFQDDQEISGMPDISIISWFHLSDGVAAGVPNPRVGVRDVGHHSFHQLLQVGLHLFVTSLPRGRDCHQSSMTILPVRVLRRTLSIPHNQEDKMCHIKQCMSQVLEARAAYGTVQVLCPALLWHLWPESQAREQDVLLTGTGSWDPVSGRVVLRGGRSFAKTLDTATIAKKFMKIV